MTRWAVELASEYSRGRKLFGASILNNQGFAFPPVDVIIRIHASELIIRNAATLVNEARPFRTETPMVKLFATEMALEAAQCAIQVHGGYGVFQDYEVSGLLGEAKVLQLVEGTSEIQRLVIARELLFG